MNTIYILLCGESTCIAKVIGQGESKSLRKGITNLFNVTLYFTRISNQISLLIDLSICLDCYYRKRWSVDALDVEQFRWLWPMYQWNYRAWVLQNIGSCPLTHSEMNVIIVRGAKDYVSVRGGLWPFVSFPSSVQIFKPTKLNKKILRVVHERYTWKRVANELENNVVGKSVLLNWIC